MLVVKVVGLVVVSVLVIGLFEPQVISMLWSGHSPRYHAVEPHFVELGSVCEKHHQTALPKMLSLIIRPDIRKWIIMGFERVLLIGLEGCCGCMRG